MKCESKLGRQLGNGVLSQKEKSAQSDWNGPFGEYVKESKEATVARGDGHIITD